MWKNLKSYFIVEEDDPKSAKKPSTKMKPGIGGKQSTAKPQADSTLPTAPAAAPITTEGEVNDRFVKVLMEAMERANQPGFDYLEYKKALQNLKKMNFTDSVRFQTAYATAQSMGVTPKALVDSAQHYLSALNQEQQKFGQALKGQRAQQVSDKELQLKQLDESISQQETKIKELQAQIAKTKTEQKKLRDTINKSTSKLAKTQADFEQTFTVITEGIKKDIGQMQEFLK
ncbi:MAG: hypothetical protein AAGA31_15200 [Bacteroidota bacterium]